MDTTHSCLKITVRPTDYRLGDGQLKIKGVTTSNWISHFDFFVPQLITGGDTDDCWDFGATKNVDAFMDALISDGLIPPAVLQQITQWGFMDTGIDGKPHFHSSERFAGVLSGLGQSGGNLYTAQDIFRKYGLAPFTLLPVTANMTLAEYFAPVPESVMTIAKQFLDLMGGADFCQYQWVNDGGATNVAKMASALPNGPLGLGIPVSPTGWNQQTPTIATGSPVHVVSAYSITGESVNVSDNYEPYLKVLDPGYQMSYVLQTIVQYIPPAPAPTLPPNPTPVQTTTFLQDVANWLASLLDRLSGALKGRKK